MKRADPLYLIPFLLLGAIVSLVVRDELRSKDPGIRAQAGLLSRWDRGLGSMARGPTQQQARTLAADPLPRCLKDRVTGPGLRAEITRLETAQTGARPARGVWMGIDKSQLKPAQASFLSTSRTQWIYTTGLDFSSCKDATCVMNTVYGSPESDTGHHLYGWFLGTGYFLSATNQAQNTAFPPGIPYVDFLFTPDEALAYWKLSLTLGDRLRQISKLATIHRFPKNYGFGGTRSNACGLAYSQGYIHLTGACLSLSFQDHRDLTATFYRNVTHEIAHHLDFVTDLSEKPDWRVLSGWSIEEVVDPASQRTIRRWKSKSGESGYDGFVRDYAGTAPQEDFAESVAYYRYLPGVMNAENFPRKHSYLRQTIYAGRSFDPDSLLLHYETQARASVTASLIDLTTACATNPEAILAGLPTRADGAEIPGLDRSLPDVFVACLSRSLDARIDQALDEVRAKEYEACDLLATNESVIRNNIVSTLSERIVQLASEKNSLAPILQAARELRTQVAEQLDPREAYLSCREQSATSPESCYTDALKSGFDRLAAAFSETLGDKAAVERDAYLAEHPWTATEARVTAYFKTLMAGFENSLDSFADKRWRRCMSQPDDPTAQAIFQPFTGGDRYVSASMLRCVNNGLTQEYRETRDRFLSRLGLSLLESPASRLIEELDFPLVLRLLNTALAKDAAAEESAREAKKSAVRDQIVSHLVGDVSWVGKALTQSQALERCKPEAIRAFPALEVPSKFKSIEDLRVAWSQEACTQAVASASVTSAIERAVEEAWVQSQSEFAAIASQLATRSADSCQATHAQSSDTVRRTDCLTRGWAAIEKSSLDAWIATPSGRFFANRRAQALTLLQSERARLQSLALTQAAERAVRLTELRQSAISDIADRLKEDLSWLEDSIHTSESAPRCARASLFAWDGWASRLDASVWQGVPATQAQVRNPWSKAACDSVLARPEVEERWKTNRETAWASATSQIDQLLIAEVDNLARECARLNPGAAAAAQRTSCLTGSRWRTVAERLTVSKWLVTPMGKRLQADRARAIAYLEHNRERFKGEAVARHTAPPPTPRP